MEGHLSTLYYSELLLRNHQTFLTCLMPNALHGSAFLNNLLRIVIPTYYEKINIDLSFVSNSSIQMRVQMFNGYQPMGNNAKPQTNPGCKHTPMSLSVSTGLSLRGTGVCVCMQRAVKWLLTAAKH